MKLRTIILFILTSLGAMSSPVGIATSPDGSRLFVAMERPPGITVVETASASITATWPMPAALRSIAISPDGSNLIAPAGIAPGKILTINSSDGSVTDSIAAGHSPRSITLSADGNRFFVCNQFENQVDVFDRMEKRKTGSFPVIREPVASVLRPDGKALFIANLLPAGAANTGNIATEISVIDCKSGQTANIRLPNGSTDARAITTSPDGRFIYVVHTLARYTLPTTQLDRGWMNTSALSVIDANQSSLIATVLLDDIDLGAANPAGIACSADGKLIAVAHAGTHELSLIDRTAMHERIEAAGRGEQVTSASKSIKDIANDLSFLHGIRKRVKLAGNGPRTVVAIPGGFAVACYFSRTLHLVMAGADLTSSVRDVALGPMDDDPMRRGERMFHDATRCFQQWQSCATCHPGVRTDALNWDLLNDGVGNPKQTKSLLFSLQTPPAMVSGIRPDSETAIRTGMRYIMHIQHNEADALDIEAYLRNLQPIPSPALVDGKPSPSAQRGREVFIQAQCAKCHSGPYLTDGRAHDIHNATGRDTGKAWDTAGLRELWRTAPYLHDGRAASLEEVIGSANPGDKHGVTSGLNEQQRQDLLEFLRSL